MAKSRTRNRKFVLAERPKGVPDENTLRLETGDLPIPGKGQILLRNEYLSLDPYMRGRMSDAPSYAKPVGIGDVMWRAARSAKWLLRMCPGLPTAILS